MDSLLKLMLSSAVAASCVYAIKMFGFGLFSGLFLSLSFIVFVSLFMPTLHILSIVIARVMGVMSLLGFALLMLASTVGGSSHMSDSNRVMAVVMALIACLGCMFFFIKLRKSGSDE